MTQAQCLPNHFQLHQGDGEPPIVTLPIFGVTGGDVQTAAQRIHEVFDVINAPMEIKFHSNLALDPCYW